MVGEADTCSHKNPTSGVMAHNREQPQQTGTLRGARGSCPYLAPQTLGAPLNIWLRKPRGMMFTSKGPKVFWEIGSPLKELLCSCTHTETKQTKPSVEKASRLCGKEGHLLT